MKTTNAELFHRCYASGHMAADQLTALASQAGCLYTVAEVTKLRNTLREAYCAAQELKTRIKKGTK